MSKPFAASASAGGAADAAARAGDERRVPGGPSLMPAAAPRHDHALDLVGAFVDLRDLGVAVEPLDLDAADVAGAAMDLHRVGGARHRGVGGEALRHLSIQRRALAGVELAARRRAPSAARHACPSPCRRSSTAPPGTRRSACRTAARCLAWAMLSSSAACRMPTASAAMPTRPLSSTTSSCGSRGPPARAARRAGSSTSSKRSPPTWRGALAHLVLLALPRETPGRSQVDEEDRHAAMAGRRVGARQHRREIGDRRVVDPQLGAIQHPALAVAPRRGLQAGEVRSGLGLGQRIGAAPLGAQQRARGSASCCAARAVLASAGCRAARPARHWSATEA